MEGADLTSAVREKLESSNGAGLDLVTYSAGSASPKISLSRQYLKSLQNVLRPSWAPNSPGVGLPIVYAFTSSSMALPKKT